jgi:nitrogen fixation protein NifB
LLTYFHKDGGILLNHKSSNLNFSDKRICRHPCFNNYDFHSAVIHLPIAGASNIVYKEKLFFDDSLTESCGAATKLLITPDEAIERFVEVRKGLPNLSVAAIAGPGEALADFDSVKNVFLRIRQLHPEMLLCLATNGLMLPVYANHLISLGVNSITVTMNTFHPETGAKIYDHITYLGHNYYGTEGANILLQNQIAGISYLTSLGIAIRINIQVIRGVNEEEIKDIIRFAKECGCKFTNVMDLSTGKISENGLEAFHSDNLSEVRKEYEAIMPQSYFCKPCDPASVETQSTRFSYDFSKSMLPITGNPKKVSVTARFAVCSQNGKLTDQHFGLATRFYIYDYTDDVITFLETRLIEQYCLGSKEDKENGKIYRLIKAIEDCNCVICMRIGVCPANALKEKDIDTYTTYNLIEDGIREAVSRLYRGRRFT